MRIAVTAATGQFGRLIVEGLVADGHADETVALVRRPEEADDLGVDAREADCDRPETLGPALRNIETLMLVSTGETGSRTGQHRALIAAAVAAGVRHVVYTSVLNADTSPLSVAAQHRETEAMIRASGLIYTFLRNGGYTETYADRAPAAIKAGVLVGSTGRGRIASATRADYAEVAVVVLTSVGHENRTYELAGDTAYTLRDLASEIGTRFGTAIPYRDLPAKDYARILVSIGKPEGMAEVLAKFDVDVSHGALYHDGRDLSRLIWRPTTPLSAAVAAAFAKAEDRHPVLDELYHGRGHSDDARLPTPILRRPVLSQGGRRA